MSKGFHAMRYLQLTVTVVVLACMIAAVAAQSKSGCSSTCGDVQIPYPFGTEEGCYRDETFLITCDTTSSRHPTANYSTGNVQLLNISLNGEMRITNWVSHDCYNPSSHGTQHEFGREAWMTLGVFAMSETKNKFTVVGRDTYSSLADWESRFSTGCVLTCRNVSHVVNGSCYGIGYCQTSFSKAMRGYNISIKSFHNHTNEWDFNPYSYPFLVEDGFYNFSSQDLRNKTEFPVVLNWAVEDKSCPLAMKNTSSYACKNSECVDSESGLGYLCKCKDGFEGNPYLDHSNGGRQDIDDCRTMNPCSLKCENKPGNYSCSCPAGYEGDGYKNGTGCTLDNSSRKLLLIEIALATFGIFSYLSAMDFKFNALHNLLPYVLLLAATATAVAGQALPGCRTSCGDLNVTYPFGVGEGCYRDENFRINCNFSSGTPIANYSTGNIQVLNISLDGELTISTWVASLCYDRSGRQISGNGLSFRFDQFTISSTKNKFYVVGCDSYAFINDYWGRRFETGCTATCKNKTDVTDGSCAGIGCCQSIFPQGNMGYNITMNSYNNHTNVSAFNRCTYAFVSEDGAFNFSTLDLENLRNKKDFPLVMNWAIGTENCTQARQNTTSYACKENSYCEDSQNAPGYLCKCKVGYQGNPYLNGSNGCQDIDECKILSPCNMTCHNFDGGYNCSCPLGFIGDGFKNGTGCISESAGQSKKGFPFVDTALGISISLLVIFMAITTLCCIHKQRTLTKLRNKFFEQNGGTILQKQLSERQGYGERTKVFTEAELKQATNNFHETRILGHGGQGTVYKGILPENTLVAIKKSRLGDQSQVKDFINEVIVLSQINHRNVVRILGCCLETQVPLLVYEYVPNGTLLDHIDPAKNASSIRWETRLRIAAETAGAISYLHSAASVPIIHRDIKSSNILLDNNHTAKVSDFGASRLVPLDQTNVSTLVQGTLGYLDPEYLHTGQLNEKSDVYSFGVVLVELLTGKKAVEISRPEQQRNLAMHFVSSMKEERLLEILDGQVLNEKNVNRLKEVALLARRCLRVNGEERPSMKEVAMELEGLIAMEKHPWVKGDVMSEENENLLGNPSPNAYSISGIGSSANYDSIQRQMAFEIEDGR